MVATHRHKDHISGFETQAGGKGTGDVIRRLKPNLVMQPWTEDPDLATEGHRSGAPAQIRVRHGTRGTLPRCRSMHDVARRRWRSRRTRLAAGAARTQFYFLGESNIKNPSAVKNLMTMGKKRNYVYCGEQVRARKGCCPE